MTFQSILLPVFVLVGLTFFLLFWTGRARFGAVRNGQTRVDQIALNEPAWPGPVQQVSNAFNNQFQLPLLYYILTAFAMMTRKADLLFVVMAWIFVASRYLHAFIHITTNYVRHRFTAYLVGMIVLMLMWIIFAIHILTGI
jgi:hypothetical protein